MACSSPFDVPIDVGEINALQRLREQQDPCSTGVRGRYDPSRNISVGSSVGKVVSRSYAAVARQHAGALTTVVFGRHGGRSSRRRTSSARRRSRRGCRRQRERAVNDESSAGEMSETNVRGFDKCVIVRSLSLIPPALADQLVRSAELEHGEADGARTFDTGTELTQSFQLEDGEADSRGRSKRTTRRSVCLSLRALAGMDGRHTGNRAEHAVIECSLVWRSHALARPTTRRPTAVPPEHDRGQCTGVLSRDGRIASRNNLTHRRVDRDVSTWMVATTNTCRAWVLLLSEIGAR